jgi:hypothetical protein
MKASMLYMGFKNLEQIREIKEGPKNNSHLLPHVNTKLFHLSAHIHVFNNINFCLHNSNLSLKSCTYNLIVEAWISNNS